MLVDQQFEGLQRRMSNVNINAFSMQEHVPEVERLIRTIKEQAQATYANIPFDKIPQQMVVEMLRCIVFYLNAFPWSNGVSQTMSPLTLLEGTYLDYNLHFQVIFGEYGMVYDGTDNTMNPRMTGAIAMGPSGNHQGGTKWFSLLTGRICWEYRARHTHILGDYTINPILDTL